MTTDGGVRALVGGRSYIRSEFNRATQAKRQPGSAFKPFVFLAALEAGKTPSSRVVDAPVTYRGWTPANFSEKHEGDMTMGEALSRSINTVAVSLCLELGPETVAQAARRMGIVSNLTAVPSLALGTSEVTLAELVTAYVPFATGGRGAIAHGVKRVKAAERRNLVRTVGIGSWKTDRREGRRCDEPNAFKCNSHRHGQGCRAFEPTFSGQDRYVAGF